VAVGKQRNQQTLDERSLADDFGGQAFTQGAEGVMETGDIVATAVHRWSRLGRGGIAASLTDAAHIGSSRDLEWPQKTTKGP
jgi:hypothetical protein